MGLAGLGVQATQLLQPLLSNQWALAGVAIFGPILSIGSLILYNYLLHPIRHVPGPLLARITPLWLVRSVAGHHLNDDIRALHAKYGHVVRIAPNELSFASEEALKAIHNHQAAQFTKKGTSEELIFKLIFSAPNILTVQDPKAHKELRNVLMPAFTAKALFEQQDVTKTYVQVLVEGLGKAAATGETASLTDLTGRMVWSIVAELCFGEPADLEQLVHHEKMKDHHVHAAPYLEFMNYLTSLPVLGAMAHLAVELARVTLKPAGNVLKKEDLKGHISRQSGRKDFLTAIMGAKESAGIGEAELHSNMLLLLMGGYDSTATTLSAIFHYLLRNPAYYARLQSELRAVYPTDADIDCNTLLRQPLLNAVVNEALRLVPAFNGHGSQRMSAVDCTVDGVFVPKGTLVSADMYTLHRDPRRWALPDAFRPERWLDEENGPGTPFEKDERSAWRPFLVGPRVCIGRELALQTIRLSVARAVYNFDMNLVNTGFEWDRDAGSHFVWHDYEVLAKVRRA